MPQDASISGFGMWIGDELVEANIVEKQRAREIYETILREKRDPGLLEWQGGTSSRPASSRSRPTPKSTSASNTRKFCRGPAARSYSYALQSDMLRLHPLRKLSIDP